ncbi:uncharacterized protein LOC129761148 [Toxorhynchites rutilus septentrionalis]|uniref:uncharacterized protein LOC129761148 n=1 Tax=Toxorhynchites rutilus septentrionalis TaxID=329112 RepID=UPI00247941E2|nr:uncharacterized protein LOC129761148 [Toxorhynchites rutilus septentrionalis]
MADAQRKQVLISRRAILLASLDRAERFMTEYQEERDMLEVEVRLENLDVIWKGLEDAQSGLEEMEEDNEDMVNNLSYRSNFESLLFKIKAFLRSKLPTLTIMHANNPQTTTTGAPSTLKGLKLPTISLPEFSGDYKDWLAFHDTFLALIHNNADVADIQKFHYLRAAVKGEAAQLIESIGISTANYTLAWDALVSRYANEYLLKKRHLQALLDCPKMKRESASALHAIVDDFERHVKILGQLGEAVDAWSTILEHILCTRLHDDTLKVWEDFASTLNSVTYKHLIEFLQRRMRVLESISVNQHHQPASMQTQVSYPRKPFPTKVSSHAVVESSSLKCHACNQRHPLVKCNKFEKLPISEKLNILNFKRLCLNCFSRDHFARNCVSKYNCKVCQKRHHSLIHAAYTESSIRSNVDSSSSSSPRSTVQTNATTSEETSLLSASTLTKPEKRVCCVPMQSCNRNVFMLTVVLKVIDCYGQEHLARALLDCASQPNIISENMAQILRLRRNKVNVMIHGVGENPQLAQNSVRTQIRSRKEEFSLDVDFLVLKNVIPKLPAYNVSVDDWNLPQDLFYADPYFNKSSSIDMIIGNEHFFSCFKTAAQIHLSENLQRLIDSTFGWIVSGAASIPKNSREASACSITTVSLVTLEESLKKFWETEELPSRSAYSLEEKRCEEIYASTVSRNSEGRYVVRLPRKPNFDEMIGKSKAIALRRFELLERRLDKDIQLKREYNKFMREYLDLGHMSLVSEEEATDSMQCFLPHHPVLKEASTTTKVRVVFNASAKMSSGYSLNEALLVGPVVQDDLLSISLRFRTFPVAVVGDVEKMYRQVLHHPADTSLQQILFRFDKTEKVQTYRLLTVTYGMAPSAFLATRTLVQLANDEGDAFPLGGPALRKGFYVDDLISGAQTIPEAIQLRTELGELMAKGGFSLRKWTSNKLEVLQGLEPDQIGTQSAIQFNKEDTIKTLGISWMPEADVFRFESALRPLHGPITKRAILSGISQLFDPLGIVSPVVIRAKIMMQLLWLQPYGWDDEVSKSITEKWENYTKQLPRLSEFRVPRYALLPNANIQLHTFSDASEAAYGACTYARSVDTEGNVAVHLLASKSRVAPLKRISLPRLELCAADLATKLHAKITDALHIEISDSYFWCDSTVTLQWIRAPPNCWKTFVANRVSAIQSATIGAHWNHVAGKQNPADLVSRGMEIDDFIKCQEWKHGPKWLFLPTQQWPCQSVPEYPEDGKERRKAVVAAAIRNESRVNPYFDRFSTYTGMVSITAYCLRFFRHCREKIRTQPSSSSPLHSKLLTRDEFAAAESVLVKLAQFDGFKEELKDLRSSNAVSKKSPIRRLCPILDPEGIIRVGGRLNLLEQPYITKHPILLPNPHPYTRLLTILHHLRLIHGGGRLTLASMREKFWPICGRQLVQCVIRACFRCTRANPVPQTQQLGQLPIHRIRPARPFSIAGVDFAGPVYLRAIHKRALPAKAYICIFVCFSIKAVHIELVGDLSTAAFLAAFRRFVSRRGRPSDVYSDNGKNFEGAKNELEEIHRLLRNNAEEIHSFCTKEAINWHLCPPKAPHFGGLWEAAVKVAKAHMYKQLGNSRLSFEEMSTLLTQVEAAMNSRPLVPLSEDPNDLACVTPAHFLIGSTMHAVPELDLTKISVSILDRYQATQRLYQKFWHHWRSEYLQELQLSFKNNKPNDAFHPGRLVILVDEQQHPVKWPLARIVDVHPGHDQLIRVVTLKTPRGIVKRPITKICLLPGYDRDSDTVIRDDERRNDTDRDDSYQPPIRGE